MKTPLLSAQAAFSLVELLVVLAITAILATFSIIALPTLMSSQAMSKTASDLSQTLDQARTYAMANHTYVFVGFEEVDASKSAQATGQTQSTTTIGGRLAVAVVASIDGTNNYPGTTPAFSATNLMPICPLKFFNGVHLVAPGSIPTITGRVTGATVTSLATSGVSPLFVWPFGSATPEYTFYTNQVIQFDQDGVAYQVSSVSAVPTTPGWLELDLALVHGNSLSAPSALQVAAIQVDGVTGANHVFRP